MSTTPEMPTFAEAKGLESNQHAKKLAKEKSKKKKIVYPKYFSRNGSKIVSVCVKPSGIYREYVGNLTKKKEQAMLNVEIAKWKKDGIWIEKLDSLLKEPSFTAQEARDRGVSAKLLAYHIAECLLSELLHVLNEVHKKYRQILLLVVFFDSIHDVYILQTFSFLIRFAPGDDVSDF